MDRKIREQIIAIYSNLQHKQDLTQFAHCLTTKADDNCEDFFNLGLQFQNNQLTALGFNGEGCIISTIASELTLSALEGKTIKEAIVLLEQFMKAVQTGSLSTPLPQALQLLWDFQIDQKRLNCLLLTPQNLLQWLKDFSH
ncbi:hypothetical protein BIX79_01930 [Mycoplasmoides pneumoniae]|uniref:iron-sulfur cluster assembly scaffold protein n=1 Tax=Mycoplasmoides pneumoniae TaxID=2104 RepID=UPI000BF32C25|nr:iron-sulfur cluster assembly scaffold protein [Mycoplasmoides pneumoniae]PFH42840.1 hypothetical protein BIX79_01930 [Mycoplasmoides pneumoniae]